MSHVLAHNELEGDAEFSVGTLLFDKTTVSYVKVTKVASVITKAGMTLSITVGRTVHNVSSIEQKNDFANRFNQVSLESSRRVDREEMAQIARDEAGAIAFDLRKDLTAYVTEALISIPEDVRTFVQQSVNEEAARDEFFNTARVTVKKKPFFLFRWWRS